MARQLYSTEFVQLAGTANPAPGLPFRVWTDLTAGSDVTSQIVGPDGSSAYVAITDSQGNIAPFRGPDGYLGNLFVDTGAAYRFMLDSPTLLDYLVQQVLALLAGGGGGGGGVTDHGALSGLLDDDHPQYLTAPRGDLRYYTQAQVDAKDTAAASQNSTADRDRTNHTGFQVMSTITGLQAALDAKRDSFDASMAGTLAVTVGALGKRLPAACVLDSVTAKVGTAPAGASVIVDVLRNGTSIFATAANRPTIAAGSTGVTTPAGNASTTAFSAGDYLTVNVAQVGSTTAGADLVVSVWLRF